MLSAMLSQQGFIGVVLAGLTVVAIAELVKFGWDRAHGHARKVRPKVLILSAALVGAVLFGGSAWLITRATVGKEQVARAQFEAAKAARHQVRNQIGDLIQRGRIFQANLLSLSRVEVPNPQQTAGELVRGIAPWHMEVIRFTEMNISHADAMRVSVPPPDLNRPSGLMANIQTDANGVSHGGYDMRSLWDWVVGDLANLDRFLDQLPELKP
jgi:hypothetical protein